MMFSFDIGGTGRSNSARPLRLPVPHRRACRSLSHDSCRLSDCGAPAKTAPWRRCPALRGSFFPARV